MLLLLKLAWRNIFRNKRRTVIAGTAIGLGLATIIFVNALYIGMEELMIRLSTDTFLGQGQIHREGFRTTYEVEMTVNDHRTVLAGLSREPIIKAFSPRTLSFSMLTSAANVTSVLLVGIDPEREKEVTRVDEFVRTGAYLAPGEEGRILIGARLAETLEVGIGDRIVITTAQAWTGELAQDMLRVGGIFEMGDREMDGSMAFMPLGASQRLLGTGDRFHEIVLRFTDIGLAGDRSLPFWGRYSQGGNRAEGWTDVLPELAAIVKWVDIGNLIVFSIIFGIVTLIIVNTLFMSLHERMFEFGVIRAVGTRPARVALLILFEAGSLAVISIIIGNLIGFSASYLFSKIGIDYTGLEFAGVTFTEYLYPVLRLTHYTAYPLVILLFCLVAALYPAVFAARLVPAKAMRRSL